MPQITPCPDLNTLKRLVHDQLSESEDEGVHAHLLRCKSCSGIVARLRRTAAATVKVAGAPDGFSAPLSATGERPSSHYDPPSSHNERRQERSTPTEEVAKENTQEVPFENFGFLAPPVHPGDLGRLGNYRILKLLGEGGMGMVFQAKDLVLDRMVALKVMKPDKAATELSRKRFLQEAKAAAALQHDHIVTIYQIDEDRGVLYMAMQFLAGEPLDQRLKREGRLPIPEVLRIGRQIAEGLAAAHESGRVHRDIKPANIWLEQTSSGPPRVKILDFGLARSMDDASQNLTKTGVIVGTPGYMAPEQARGGAVDFRCDLFSLGCVMYDMCTGRQPFRGEDIMATLMALANDDPPPIKELNPDVPQFLVDLIDRLLAKDPNARPQPAKLIAETLATAELSLSKVASRSVINLRPPTQIATSAPSTDTIRNPGIPAARTPSPSSPPPRPRPSPLSGAARPAPRVPDGLIPTNSLADVEGLAIPPARPSPAATPAATTQRPAVRADTQEEIGLCPRCGAMRRKSGIPGWCMSCGYHPGMEEKAPEPPKPTGIPLWAIVLAVGFFALVISSFVGNYTLKKVSEPRAWWGMIQLVAGILAYVVANIWAYLFTIKHGTRVGFLSPIKMWTAVAEYLPESRYPLYMVTWGTTAAILAVVVIGGQWYWVDRMKYRKHKRFGPNVIALQRSADSEELADEDFAGVITITEPPPELEAEDKDKDIDEEPVKRFQDHFLVVGYLRTEDDTVTDLIIAQRDGTELVYAGLVSNGVTDEDREKIRALPRAEKPAVVSPVVGAQWVPPTEWCIIDYAKVSEFGIAQDPIFKGFHKPFAR